MTGSEIIQLILLAFLLMASGFFSSSETALMSISKIKLKHMLAAQTKGAKRIEAILENPNKVLSTILVGNNIVNIGASALATSLAIHFFGSKGVSIATLVMTILVLIFGEITPKSLASQNSEKVALKVVKPIELLMLVLTPVTKAINFITNGIIKALGGDPMDQNTLITQEELKTIINVSHEEGVLEMKEREMIHNIFEFNDNQIKSILIPRTEVAFLDINSDYQTVLEFFKRKQYSRVPVYENSFDHIVGVLNLKDFMFVNQSNFKLSDYLKTPFFTYEFVKITDLFDQMRINRVHLAMVLDEYGGTVGIITMEDLLEVIVGDIQDEYDDSLPLIERIGDFEWHVSGYSKLEDISSLLNIKISSNDFDSIGGFLLGQFGSLPDLNHEIVYKKYLFKVLEIDNNRIQKIAIKKQQ